MEAKIPSDDKTIVDIIQPDFENGPWICGGACMSWIQGEEVPSFRDIDVYFKNETQRQQFVDKLRNIHLTDSKFSHSMVQDTENSSTMWIHEKDERGNDVRQWTVQAIKLYYSNTVEEVFGKFDITACKIATDGKTYRVGSLDTIDHIKNKIIDIPSLKQNSVSRITKYLAKGYILTEDTYNRLIFATDTVWDFKYDHSLEYSK
jgi:hypothetical protein